MADGGMRALFHNLSCELDKQSSPDVERCMTSALQSVTNIPHRTQDLIVLLGKSLGKFDIDGQLKGFVSVREECKRNLAEMTHNRASRLRSYQTLGLCAGAALAILLI